MKTRATALLLLAFCSVSWADTTTGLQLLIDFENRYADQSGIGRTVNKDGTISYPAGKVGTYAGEFTSGSYLTIYDAPGGLEGVAAITHAIWVKMPNTTANYEGWNSKPSVYRPRRKDTANGSLWTYYIFDDAAHRQDMDSDANDGATTEWTHLAPDDAYDIEIIQESTGHDVLGGAGMNRSNAGASAFVPLPVAGSSQAASAIGPCYLRGTNLGAGNGFILDLQILGRASGPPESSP